MSNFATYTSPEMIARNPVLTRFDASVDYAAQAWTLATSTLEDLGDVHFSLPTVNIPDATTVPEMQMGIMPSYARPAAFQSGLSEVYLDNIEELSASLGLTTISPTSVTIPEFDVGEFSIQAPESPSDEMPSIDTDVPSLSEINLPVEPTLQTVAPVSLSEIVIPAIEEVSFPSFDAEPPVITDLVSPDAMFVFNEAPHDSNIASALRAKITSDIVAGGTGLGAAIEAELWNRGKSRLAEELEEAYNETATYWAARGYEYPPGGLHAKLRELDNKANRRIDELNTEIAIKQAELAQTNTHFMVEKGIAYEQVLMDYTNKVNERAFNAAKFTVEAAILIYQARAEAVKLRLEVYKTKASVWEIQLKAALSKLEASKLKIEAAKLTADVQAVMVQNYAVRVGALETYVKLYAAQLDGVRTLAEIDQLKLTRYKTKIEAQTAAIAAVTSKFQLYQAKWAGEEVRARVYQTQVDTYSKKVDASKVQSDINLGNLEAKLRGNEEKVKVLVAAIEKFKAQVTAETAFEDARASVYKAEADMYGEDVKAYGTWVSADAERYKAQLAGEVERIKSLVEKAKIVLETAKTEAELRAELSKAVGQIGSQLGASALSSISASAQIGFHESSSSSLNRNISSSESDSKVQQYVEEHFYNHDV